MMRNIHMRKGPIIAVNRARDHIVFHDWWCCGDAAALNWKADSRTLVGTCTAFPIENSGRISVLWNELPFSIAPTHYSSVAALSLAWMLGFKNIRVIGHDMTGFPGDGADANRWEVEGRMWSDISTRISALGGNIQRMKDDHGQ